MPLPHATTLGVPASAADAQARREQWMSSRRLVHRVYRAVALGARPCTHWCVGARPGVWPRAVIACLTLAARPSELWSKVVYG